MTTATVTGPLLADDLTVLGHRPVRISLQGGSHYSAGELVQSLSILTDNNGQFSVVLPINPQITPAGSTYLVKCAGHEWVIALPSAGTWRVGDLAIQATTGLVASGGATTGYVDAINAALDARLDTLEAAVTRGVFALGGFVDLAGQTRTMFRAAISGTAQNPVVALKAGRIEGLSVSATAARTAGTSTFTALINGASAGITTVIDATSPQFAHTAGTATFVAGDRLTISHADAGFTPSTNFEATMWASYDPA